MQLEETRYGIGLFTKTVLGTVPNPGVQAWTICGAGWQLPAKSGFWATCNKKHTICGSFTLITWNWDGDKKNINQSIKLYYIYLRPIFRDNCSFLNYDLIKNKLVRVGFRWKSSTERDRSSDCILLFYLVKNCTWAAPYEEINLTWRNFSISRKYARISRVRVVVDYAVTAPQAGELPPPPFVAISLWLFLLKLGLN